MPRGGTDGERASGTPSGGDPSGTRALVIVDGSNAAHGAVRGRASLARLLRIRDAVRATGGETTVIVDAGLRHAIDEPERLEALLDAGEIIQTPARRQADEFIEQLAREERDKGRTVYVVTNDLFPTKVEPPIPRITFLVVPLGAGERILFSPALDTLTEEASPPRPVPPAAPAAPEAPVPAPAAEPPSPPEEPRPAEIPEELFDALVDFFGSRGTPPAAGERIAFTDIAKYLHGRFDGDFRRRFGYRKAKDFALALEANGYARTHRLGVGGLAMYLEVTPTLAARCDARGS